ncbi:hypothetical protein G6F59_015847 [Rhizopus arrhizus]|nr:hypothetical protein G6F59_015847 [Rhizopus arrhizus]
MAAGPRHRRGAGSGRRTDPAADAAVASAEAAFSSTLWKLMMDTTAEHEIHRLHDKLQAWFRAEACIDALDDLMAHFCSDFSMVGIAGRRLDRHAVQAFRAGVGSAITVGSAALSRRACDRWRRARMARVAGGTEAGAGALVLAGAA